MGTVVFAVFVIGVAISVGLSFAMNTAADDLRQQVLVATGQGAEHARTAWGSAFSASMASDIKAGDSATMLERSQELDHRADRIRELAGAGALMGLLVMLVTARPEARLGSARAEASPAASTRSNGTV